MFIFYVKIFNIYKGNKHPRFRIIFEIELCNLNILFLSFQKFGGPTIV